MLPGSNVAYRRFFHGVPILLACALACAKDANAQGLEGILVETYHVQEPTDPDQGPLVTYRIYVDLAPDHLLQVVFGSEFHRLKIETTTDFYNAPASNAMYGDKLPADRLNDHALALDSWLTMGAASDHHMGVPRALDPDGSILECPPYPAVSRAEAQGRPSADASLCTRDGLIAASVVKEVVSWKMIPSYLDTIRGGTLLTVDGAWAVLGGIKGVTDQDLVLIAQLTTTGMLSFRLNLQIRTPDGQVVRYVASDPRNDEVLFEGLIRAPK